MAIGSPLSAKIAASSSGDNTIIAGVAGYRIAVVGYVLVASGTVNAKFKDGASTDLTGPMNLVANAGVSAPLAGINEAAQMSWFQTSAGNALVLNLSGATEVDGHCVYCLIPA